MVSILSIIERFPLGCKTHRMLLVDKRIHYSYTSPSMTHTTIHIKTDVKTRDNAKKVAEEFGFTLTSLVNAMLKQIARTRSWTLSLDETPNQAAIEAMKQSEEDVKAGRVSPSFTNAKDAMAWLNDPEARFQNGDKVH